MKGEGWITGPALEVAFKVGDKGIKPGDDIFCTNCGAAHTVSHWEGDTIVLQNTSDGTHIRPVRFAELIGGWRPK